MKRPNFSLDAVTLLAAAVLLSACGGVRLQTQDEAVRGLADGAQAHARQSCEKHRDSSAYFECRKRVEKNYDAWRDERANKDSDKRS